jgi:hypothetical protein
MEEAREDAAAKEVPEEDEIIDVDFKEEDK